MKSGVKMCRRGRIVNGVVLFLIASIASFAICAFDKAEAEETLKIGVLVPLSGVLADGGNKMLNGFKLAAEEINSSGGVLGRNLELITWDDEGKPDKGASGVTKLITHDNVWGFVGGLASGVTLAQIPIVVKNKRILVVTDSGSKKITEGVRRDYGTYKYIFMVSPRMDRWATPIVQYVADTFRKKSYYWIGEDAVWSREWASDTKEGMRKKGVECLGEAYHGYEKTEFFAELERVRQADPDIVFAAQTSITSVPFAKQYYSAKLRMPFVSGASPMLDREVIGGMGEQGNYICFFDHGYEGPMTPKTLPWVERYKKKFGVSPTYYQSGNSYDGLWLLVDAIRRAKSFDQEKVIGALEKSHYIGVDGAYVFDEEHSAIYSDKGDHVSFVIGQWYMGKETILWPEKWKTGNFRPYPWAEKK